MEPQITWELPRVELVRTASHENVVRTVLYRIIGTLNGRTAVREGSFILDAPGGAFVPYDDLTLDVVVGWLRTRFSESVDAHLSSIRYELVSEEAVEVTPHFATVG